MFWIGNGNFKLGATGNTHKTCNKCNRFLPMVLFGKHSLVKDGRCGTCKHCTKMADRKKRSRKPRKSFEERFWSQVKIENNACWEWTGAKDTPGYGHMSINGKTNRVHRESYKIFWGEIPNGLHILHKCDNRVCVNPDHLFPGTDNDNVQDMITKGRQRGAKGERNCKSKLIVNNIREIRKLHKSGIMPTELAKLYGVHKCTISRIVARKTWNHID